jgi:hypothetical protein
MLCDSLGELGARIAKRRVRFVAQRSGATGRAGSEDTGALSIAGLAALGLCAPADSEMPGAKCRVLHR